MPVARLVAPGPSVAMQSPGAPVMRPVTSAAKPGRALVRGEHEIDAALAHRLHQRQHVAARNAEAAPDAGRFQRGDDQVGIVHGTVRPCCIGRALWHTSEAAIKLLRSALSRAWRDNRSMKAKSTATRLATERPLDKAFIDDLVAANRTLARLNVLDAFGHVSVRDPRNPRRYLISRSIAPESVTAARYSPPRPRQPDRRSQGRRQTALPRAFHPRRNL